MKSVDGVAIAEVQPVEAFATAEVIESEADMKVLLVKLLASLAYRRTSAQRPQTEGHPERDQLR